MPKSGGGIDSDLIARVVIPATIAANIIHDDMANTW